MSNYKPIQIIRGNGAIVCADNQKEVVVKLTESDQSVTIYLQDGSVIQLG
jgi:hypothetical protein